MANPITNRLRLVETIHFDGLPLLGFIKVPWFDQVVPVMEGVNQEVFRGEDHIGSVYPSNGQAENAGNAFMPLVKARRGDLIYRVSLTPQPYDLTGVITTKDGYRRVYQVRLELLVKNSSRCLERYRDSEDPAALAIGQFKVAFERFVSRYAHDEVDHMRLAFDGLNNQLSDYCGIIIERSNYSSHTDLRREQELEIQQKTELKKREVMAEVEAKMFELRQRAELKKEELATDAEVKELEEKIRMKRESLQKQFDRDEKVKQSDFARAEKMKHHLNEARIKLLSMTVNDLTAINSERIRDAFDSNASVRAVLEDSLKLLGVFSGSNRKSEEVVDSNLLNGDRAVNAEEGESGPDATINSL